MIQGVGSGLCLLGLSGFTGMEAYRRLLVIVRQV